MIRVYGPINTLKAVIAELLAKYPNTKHFEVATDTSKNEFKSVSVFQRVAAIANSLQKTFLLCYFGPEYVKYLCDSAGCLWVNNILESALQPWMAKRQTSTLLQER